MPIFRYFSRQVCPMLKYSDIYDIWEPITIEIFNESLQTFEYILPVGQCTPDKNVTYVSDVMPRQYTSSLTIQWRISQKLDRQFLSNIFHGNLLGSTIDLKI